LRSTRSLKLSNAATKKEIDKVERKNTILKINVSLQDFKLIITLKFSGRYRRAKDLKKCVTAIYI